MSLMDVERQMEDSLGSMDKRGKTKKSVDWVALIDELWASDDEDVSKSRGQSSSVVKVSSYVSGEACVGERDVKDSRPSSPLEQNMLETEQYPCSKVLNVVSEPICPLEDPLTIKEGDDSPPCTDESSIRTTSHRIQRTRQTDLLSFIDHKYCLPNRSPLTEIENSTHSDSTDDGYMTSDNSRVDYTPQLSLPNTGSDTQHPRALFYHKSISRPVRKRKASGPLGTAKRPKVHHGSDVAKKENSEQLYLDLGQKNFGHVTCKVCGMIYTIGEPSDQAEHLQFHKSFLSGVAFPGWKKEHVVGVFYDGRIIMVLPTDPKLHLKKVEEIRKLVDFELGYVTGAPMASNNYKVFLYISLRKRVMGCVFAEGITQGYQVLGDENQEREGGTTGSWLCSTCPQPAQLGVNRLWVSAPCRRKGIASKLLDAARSNFMTGYAVPKSKVAFTDPTPDGKLFASRYSSTPNFLVYHWV